MVYKAMKKLKDKWVLNLDRSGQGKLYNYDRNVDACFETARITIDIHEPDAEKKVMRMIQMANFRQRSK